MKTNNLDLSNLYRGRLITAFATMEKKLDFVLAGYFSVNPKSQYYMMQILLDRMTFESKRTALKALYDARSEQDGFVKTKNNSYPHNKFFNEIRRLNDHRNYFAHYYLLQAEEEEIIVLADNRDNTSFVSYTEKELKILLSDIEAIGEQILDVTKLPNAPPA